MLPLLSPPTDPTDLGRAVLVCGTSFLRGGRVVSPSGVLIPHASFSMARVYKDIFLLYDTKTEQWVLSRIAVD